MKAIKMSDKKIINYNQPKPEGMALITEIVNCLWQLDDERRLQFLNLLQAFSTFDNSSNEHLGDLNGHRPDVIGLSYHKLKLAAIVQGVTKDGESFCHDYITLFREPSDDEN